MNGALNPFGRAYEIIRKSTSGAILLPQNPSIDATLAAISLADVINTMVPSKHISIACENPPKNDLISPDRIQTAITTKGNNLIISFPYTDGSIDKVDYNIQGNSFNLVIIPRSESSKLNPEQVRFSYTGGTVDFIITMDAPTLNSLGSIYLDNQQMFQGKEIINIDRHLTNAMFGSVNVVDKASSSLSEMVFKLLSGLPEVEINRETASSLYAGISAATNTFSSYSVNADTFEIASKLLRLGAVKKRLASLQPLAPKTPLNAFDSPKPAPVQEADQTPQDWLKPKIFRGGGLI
ncbi:hypothetical protein COT62_03530 [Candidatus Roizmanbacteria bacterium CG09_land_8_20_14_0_10_41_9]|uniref:DDH domain-containing protein n=1 Tax=Candidatus Roizmanbacteria bacterium CG09_land_8_20_14_0_10_41_9 TaxID=1974850 RepID=A0A2H0WS69_9BACT|nr:MAG: hypothetical protein COT62_03530 [Candidatus Roizmanbacteria bacterium CG09_land_8_20_14_0_10_41_9]